MVGYMSLWGDDGRMDRCCSSLLVVEVVLDGGTGDAFD